MTDVAYPLEDFPLLVQPLLGLIVSLAWKGYGSAIFLELGELTARESPHQRHSAGEAGVSVEWDWRVEVNAKVLYGSSNSQPKIDAGIATLLGSTIQSLAIVGQVPELVIEFSNGHCLRSMVMVTGDPDWSVKLLDGTHVYAMSGRLLRGAGASEEVTDEEEATFAIAERTASRWGIPSVEPKRGVCANCTSFVPVDGNGHLLDYGVCVDPNSVFDGRAVNRNSGCPSFKNATF